MTKIAAIIRKLDLTESLLNTVTYRNNLLIALQYYVNYNLHYTSSGGSSIWAANSKGEGTELLFGQFVSWKLRENESNWVKMGGTCPWSPTGSANVHPYPSIVFVSDTFGIFYIL